MEAKGRADVSVVLAVTVTILCWSSNFPTIRFVQQVYDPNTMSVLRGLVGAGTLALYAVAIRMPLPAARDWPAFALFGLTGIALSTLFLNHGLRTVSAGAGSFLIGTVPIFSALLARLFLAERLSGRGWLGIGVSFAGVGLIALGEGEGLSLDAGALLIVASALNQAFFYVFQKFYLRRYSPLQVTCYAIWSGAVALLVFLPGLPGVLARAPMAHTLAVVYLGLFPHVLAFACWAYALSRAGAAKVTSSMYALPALAIIIAWFWLGEIPSPLSLLGGVVALAGVATLHLAAR